ncbi:MAG TPA: DUF4244 domain-containing protein, partial [Nakamurella sp.]
MQLVSLVKVGVPAQRGRCRCAVRCESICVESPGSPGSAEVLDPVPVDNSSDAGMSTVEYAVGTVVAAAFAAVLYQIV